MQTINIGQMIARERKKIGWTQQDIAKHLHVTKAAVSKWETGQSYPDALLLPQLAALFGITLDALVGYTPQMSGQDIKALYHRLAVDFSTQPFETVRDECLLTCKRYYSCHPLLLSMGTLLLNHHTLAATPEQSADTIREALRLFTRARENSRDVGLARQGMDMEAMCLIALNQPEEALAVLSPGDVDVSSSEILQASAYQMTGQHIQAKTILQCSMYKHMINLLNTMIVYLDTCHEDENLFEQTVHRAQSIIQAFQVESLHPALLVTFYLAAASGYMRLKKDGLALNMLERLAQVASKNMYPVKLRGDAYFCLIDDWLENTLPLGNSAPRNEEKIRQDLIAAVQHNPLFEPLRSDTRFSSIIKQLTK